MKNQDWERFGEDIRRTVQDAVDSQDFNRLNQTITNTVNHAMDGLEKGIHTMGDAVGDAVDKTAKNFKNPGRTAAGSPTGIHTGTREARGRKTQVTDGTRIPDKVGNRDGRDKERRTAQRMQAYSTEPCRIPRLFRRIPDCL